jgi:hypothetical protein
MTAAPQQNPPPTAPDRGIDIANNMTDAVQVANDCAGRRLTGGELELRGHDALKDRRQLVGCLRRCTFPHSPGGRRLR